MTRMYETIFIVQPDLADDDLKALSAKVQEIVASMKGDLKKLEDWGMRKLAYPINKFSRGRYYYMRFDGDAALIAELERRLRLDDKVIRYQSVKLESEIAAPPVRTVPVEEAPAAEPAEPAAETE